MILDGAPGPDPRVIHGRIDAGVRRIWSHCELFVTALPGLRLADATNVGKQKARAINAALSAWPQVRGAAQKLLCGQLADFGPRYTCLLLVGAARAMDPSSALNEQGLWSPPGGWEDLVLVGGSKVLAWSCTHDSLSVFPARFLEAGIGHVPKFSVQVVVRGEELTAELVSELLA